MTIKRTITSAIDLHGLNTGVVNALQDLRPDFFMIILILFNERWFIDQVKGEAITFMLTSLYTRSNHNIVLPGNKHME